MTSLRTLLFACCAALLWNCGNSGNDARFNGKPSTLLTVQSRISRDHDKPPTPQQIDTIHPGDSVMLQGAIAPERNTKTKGHWWRIDGSIMPDTAGFYLHWVFDKPGKHLAIFGVIDAFGDSLVDTAIAYVSTPPQLGLHFIPRDSAWGIKEGILGGMPFEWDATEADSGTALRHHFRLYQKDSLVLDTFLTEARVTYWGGLLPLTTYLWKVNVINQYGFMTDTLQARFSTGTLDGLGALQVSTNSSVRGLLHRLGGLSDTLVSNGKDAMRFSPLVAGEYVLMLEDTLHTGFEPETLHTTLHEAQFKDFGAITLSDITPPQLKCGDCYKDTLPENLPIQIPFFEKGSGLALSKCSALVDGNNVALSVTNDTLIISTISWVLTPEFHQVKINLVDNAGNDSLYTYWLPVRHSLLTPAGGYP